MDNKPDSETREITEEQRKLQELTKSEGWGVARGKLIEYIMDMQSVMNITAKTGEEAIIDIKARMTVVESLNNWLSEIEGTAQQYESNKELITNKKVDHFVRR